jgi:hypothetical protein
MFSRALDPAFKALIKGLLREWEKKYPGRVESIFSSLSTVVPSHLMDRDLFGKLFRQK